MLDTRVGRYAVPVSLSLLLLHQCWRAVRRPKIRHPPSPTSLPLVGNLFSIPPLQEHLAFAKLGEQLESDIVYLELLGQKIIILNSVDDALELLEKRSAFYSDRPQIPMVAEPTLMNWSTLPSLTRYNDLWRHYRRMMNNWLNARAVTQFDDLQARQGRLLLRRLLSTTNHAQPFEHIKNEFFFMMASSMFELAYGYKLQDPEDPFFKEGKITLQNVLSAGMQTNFLVNIFPALLYVPDWFPGTGWKRTGREWGIQQEKAKREPYEWVKAQVASGTYQPSLLSHLLQDHKLLSGLTLAEKDLRMKEIGFTMYGGGTDTSATFLVNFVSAMVLNPDVQAKAQHELDSVLGQAVLPNVLDRERLPYLRNLIDEVARLYPILPLALPHICFRDNTYKGYDIEKGTSILGNLWAIGRDSRHYDNPEMFNPDRYLDPDVPRPPVFGWGRRKCPGIHFAETSVFITTALMLSVFTFSKRKDSSGRVIEPRVELERNSLMFELKPFDFELKVRSDAHRQLAFGGGED
ncbi:cytochrome P450 [Rhizoctonia solani]|nr:cytochrome P450 [Rhizoctonia solani]